MADFCVGHMTDFCGCLCLEEAVANFREAAIWGRFVGEGDYQEARFHDNPVDNYFAGFLEPREDPSHLQSGAAAFEYLLE
jgi:hypothetical protein